MNQRRNRLGLVPVNPNPQPPNAPRQTSGLQRPNQGNNGNHNGNGHPNGRNRDPNYSGNTGGGHAPPRPRLKPPKHTGPTGTVSKPDPNNPFAPPTYTPGAGQPDPRDNTYYTNVARLQAEAQQNYANIGLSQSYANTDFNKAQENLALNQQLDTTKLAGDVFRSGLSASGYNNTQTANLTNAYTRQQGDLSTDKFRSDAAREAAKEALLQGFPMDVAAEYAAAADRYAQLQATNAQSGAGINKHKDLKAIRKLLNKRGGKGHGGKH